MEVVGELSRCRDCGVRSRDPPSRGARESATRSAPCRTTFPLVDSCEFVHSYLTFRAKGPWSVWGCDADIGDLEGLERPPGLQRPPSPGRYYLASSFCTVSVQGTKV